MDVRSLETVFNNILQDDVALRITLDQDINGLSARRKSFCEVALGNRLKYSFPTPLWIILPLS